MTPVGARSGSGSGPPTSPTGESTAPPPAAPGTVATQRSVQGQVFLLLQGMGQERLLLVLLLTEDFRDAIVTGQASLGPRRSQGPVQTRDRNTLPYVFSVREADLQGSALVGAHRGPTGSHTSRRGGVGRGTGESRSRRPPLYERGVPPP